MRRRSNAVSRDGACRRVFTKLVKDENATMATLHQARRFLEGMDSFVSKSDLLAQLEDNRHCGLHRVREVLSFVQSLQDIEDLFIRLLQHIMTDETERPMFIGLRNKVLLAIFNVPGLLTTLVENQAAESLDTNSAKVLCSFLLATSSAYIEARQSQFVIELAKDLRHRGDISLSNKLCNCLLIDVATKEEEVVEGTGAAGCLLGRVNNLFQNKPTVACWVQDRVPPGGRHDNDHRNFRDINIVPTVEELKSESVSWLPLASGENAIIQDPAMYLIDKNFRLLREDAVRTMKNNISESKRVWKHARVIDLEGRTKRSKMSFLVQCDTRGSTKRDWERSRDLMHGCIVAFCHDGIPEMLGVISTREYDKPNEWLNALGGPIVGVEFPSDDDFTKALRDMQYNCDFNNRVDQLKGSLSENDGDAGDRQIFELIETHKKSLRAYDMIEVSSSFFSYQPILKALQGMMDLPFRSELCGDSDDEDSGQLDYLPETLSMPNDPDFGGFRFDLRLWSIDKVVEATSLDNSQAAAVYHALTHRVSLIQGPPGTGGSYTV